MRTLSADLFAPGSAAAPAAERSPASVQANPPTTVLRAVGELSATHRERLIELLCCGGSLEGAARTGGLPVGAVKPQLHAMRALRSVLDQQVADRHGTPVSAARPVRR